MIKTNAILKGFFFSVFLLCQAFTDAGSDFVESGKGPNELTTSEYIAIVASFLPDNPYILEAGAHSGEDTVIFAKKWPHGLIFAFEPVPRFYQSIIQNLRNHKVSNVRAFPIGLFSSTGDHTFYYSQNCGGASSFLPEGDMPETNYGDVQMTLPCMTLDDWASFYSVDHIDFMWLDMEGAEYYMLKASPRMLQTTKVILSEISFRSFREGHTLYDTLKPFLEENGFVLYKIWGSPKWQATGLFVRKEFLNNKD